MANDATQFPIDYEAKQMIDTTAPDEIKPSRGHHNERIQRLVHEHKSSLRNIDLKHEKLEEELTQYATQLDEWLEEHQKLSARLKKLHERNKTVADLVRKERGELQKVHESADDNKKKRETLTQKLAAVITTEEIIAAIDDIKTNNTTTETWMKDCQHLFPDEKVVHLSHQVRHTTLLNLFSTLNQYSIHKFSFEF